jgi:hypothetical protein
MDVRAELTLRLIRTGQEALDPRSSMVDWMVFPEMTQVSWPGAAEILASAPKPVLVCALVEPGTIALWSMAALAHRGRAALEHQIQNQSGYYDAKLSALGLAVADSIETPDDEFRLSVAEFKEWAREYCITIVGVGMGASPSAGIGRLFVRRPGGHQAPVGWVDAAS